MAGNGAFCKPLKQNRLLQDQNLQEHCEFSFYYQDNDVEQEESDKDSEAFENAEYAYLEKVVSVLKDNISNYFLKIYRDAQKRSQQDNFQASMKQAWNEIAKKNREIYEKNQVKYFKDNAAFCDQFLSSFVFNQELFLDRAPDYRAPQLLFSKTRYQIAGLILIEVFAGYGKVENLIVRIVKDVQLRYPRFFFQVIEPKFIDEKLLKNPFFQRYLKAGDDALREVACNLMQHCKQRNIYLDLEYSQAFYSLENGEKRVIKLCNGQSLFPEDLLAYKF